MMFCKENEKHRSRTGRLLGTTLVLVTLALFPLASAAEESHEIDLSAGLLKLLQEEMSAISKGVEVIAPAIAAGEWATVRDTSRTIRDSYIMNRQLTAEQKQELKQKLPEQFKHMDADLHQRADELAVAATTHDAELVSFRFSRMLESCASCHAVYATTRFPGLAPAPAAEHSHSH